MPFCNKCGASVLEVDQYCFRCGNPTGVFQVPKKRELNVAMLVFSIVVILLGSLPLGAIALVFTILATEETTDQGEKDKLKIAKILNIIGIVIMAVTVIAFVAYVIVQIVFSVGSMVMFMQSFGSGFEEFMEIFMRIMETMENIA